MTKKLTKAQRTGKLGELIAEKVVYDTLGFSYHPAGDLEAGTDGFIEVCDLDTGAPCGRYIAVQIKSTSKGQLNYVASADDLLYWQNQNLPFLLLRVLVPESQVLWKLINHETKPGIIRFSRNEDVLDRAAAETLSRIVDDRHVLESVEFRGRLAKISLDQAAEDCESGNYQRSMRCCDRAIHLAKIVGLDEIVNDAHVLQATVCERYHQVISSERQEIDSVGGLIQMERVWRSIDSLKVPHAEDRKHAAEVLGLLGADAAEALPALCTGSIPRFLTKSCENRSNAR